MANSAADTMFEVGAFTTMTPAVVADLTSTLSSPTPARAMTLRFLPAAIASASSLVAERIRMALASASAASRAGRSVPSRCRMSKSGPSASTVAGESSSAISTIGFATNRILRQGEWGSPRRTRARHQATLVQSEPRASPCDVRRPVGGRCGSAGQQTREGAEAQGHRGDGRQAGQEHERRSARRQAPAEPERERVDPGGSSRLAMSAIHGTATGAQTNRQAWR